MARLFIGTSGWNYDEWKNGFYQGVAKKDWLRHCGEVFTAAEINATFYGLQKRETLARWRDETPDDFVFALKANRYLTHYRRFRDPEEPIIKDRDRAEALGGKLGAVLWQLPGNFHRKADTEARFDGFLRALGKRWRTRHAVELRHASWFDDDVAERLSDHGVAVCISDAANWPMWKATTADFVYVRLHGHTRTYHSRYAKRSLEKWARDIDRWLRGGRDVHVYFDNTDAGAAPRDAQRLRELLGR